MLIKEILDALDLNVYLPNNLLNEDLEDVEPKDYVKNGNSYIINFKDSTFRIIINTGSLQEYLIMMETFEGIRDMYVCYDIDGNINELA